MWKWRKARRSGVDPTGPADAGDTLSAPVALPLDVKDPAFLDDPARAQAVLRQDHPLCPLKGGGFVLTRHTDVVQALSSRELGNAPSRFSVLHAKNREKHVAASVAQNILPFLDAPDHRGPRQKLSRAFYQTFQDFQPQIDRISDKVITDLAGQGPVDLVEGPARDFACQTSAAFVGLTGETGQVKTLSKAFFRLFAPMQNTEDFAQTNFQLAEARSFVAKGLRDRSADGTPCLLTALSRAGEKGPAMEAAQIIDTAILVLADGIENIEAGIGQVMRRLQTDPSDCVDDGYVREVLRLDTPALMIPRVCRHASTLNGVDMAAGTPVFLSLASANRDPEAIAQAAL
jgi:cytochrome P450